MGSCFKHLQFPPVVSRVRYVDKGTPELSSADVKSPFSCIFIDLPFPESSYADSSTAVVSLIVKVITVSEASEVRI